jgi:hypothetical protein
MMSDCHSRFDWVTNADHGVPASRAKSGCPVDSADFSTR